MSVIYRDRERDREWDTTRSTGGRTSTYRDSERDREGYSVKKIYRIPGQDVEEDRLSIYRGDDRRSDRERDVQETRIIRRERTPEPEPERREIRIVREERSREREPEPRRVEREIRYEREYDRLAPSRDRYDYDRSDRGDRNDLQRYTREVEYYPRPDPPQPIIIRQEPQQIIIQEAPRAPVVVPQIEKESEFQMVKRSEVDDTRSVVSRKPKSEKGNEEEYYYEKRVREVSRDNRGRDDEYEEDRYSRRREREVSPGDSISQVGGRERDRRRYSSDDSYDYVERRETREGDSDDDDPRHRRHLAEGAIAGIGAAELLRHHRKKEDGEVGSRRGRVGKDVGAAALGAIAAEGVTRARSHYRSKSRRGSRERSRSREGGRRKHRRDKSRSRSRSRSKSRTRTLAKLGLGAAAVAAAAAYANKQRKDNKEDRRSRSRTRRDSIPPEDADDARNPSHRNKKIAQAGLAGAAVAGLVERARSKSRGGRDRSKSRIRQGIPIAAAGLGSAAIAGLYERNQAGKEEKKDKEARREERAARRAARSRSRSMGAEGSRDVPGGEPGMIEYGDGTVYGNNGVPDYYNRPASQQAYYGNTEAAMVPAAGAAAYGAQRERERSISSSGSENDRRRRRRHRRRNDDSRSRSRSRGLAAAALGAGAGALGASEYEKNKQRRKEEKRERKRSSLMLSSYKEVR